MLSCVYKLCPSSPSQADQLMFAVHFVKGMYPELFQESVSIFAHLVIGVLDLPDVTQLHSAVGMGCLHWSRCR